MKMLKRSFESFPVFVHCTEGICEQNAAYFNCEVAEIHFTEILFWRKGKPHVGFYLLFIFLNLFSLKIQLIYNAMLASGVQQNDSYLFLFFFQILFP